MNTMPSEQTLGELFEMAMQIELKAASIYAVFVKAFSEVPEMERFWQSMQQDEQEHFRILKSVYDDISPDTLTDQVNTKIWNIAKDTLIFIDSINLAHVVTLDHAYNLAHDLEYSEVNAIFKFLTLDIITCKQSDTFIDHIINEHIRKLKDFHQNFGDKAWRKSIPARKFDRQTA